MAKKKKQRVGDHLLKDVKTRMKKGKESYGQYYLQIITAMLYWTCTKNF